MIKNYIQTIIKTQYLYRFSEKQTKMTFEERQMIQTLKLFKEQFKMTDEEINELVGNPVQKEGEEEGSAEPQVEEDTQKGPARIKTPQTLMKQWIDIHVQRGLMKRAKKKILPFKYEEEINQQFDEAIQGMQESLTPNIFDKFKQKHINPYSKQLYTSLKEYQQDEQKIEQVMPILGECIKNKSYHCMKEEEFQSLFMNSQFPEYVNIFDSEFFLRNQTFINESLIQQFLDKNRHKHLVILRFVQLSQQYPFFKDSEQFLTYVQQHSDPLTQFYFFYHENSIQLMNQINLDYFYKCLPTINFGSDINHKSLQITLQNLLFVKYKLKLTQQLKLYLADLFFGSQTFDHGIIALVIQFLILQRLILNQSISDLLYMFKESFGDDRFKFYLEQELPEVLKSYNTHQYLSIYKRGLAEYQLQKQFKQQFHSSLDNLFYKNGTITVSNVKIQYNPSSFNVFVNRSKNSQYDKKRFQQALINNDENYLNQFLANEMNLDADDQTIIKAQQLLSAFRYDQKSLKSALMNPNAYAYVLKALQKKDQGIIQLEETDDPNALVQLDPSKEDLYVDSDDEQLFLSIVEKMQAQRAQQQAEKKEEIKESNQEQGNQQQSESTQSLNHQSKFGYSNQIRPDKNAEKEGGFLNYLKSAKKIDLEVQQQEVSKAQKEAEISKMKGIFQKDDENLKLIQTEMKKKSQQLFQRVSVRSQQSQQQQQQNQQFKKNKRQFQDLQEEIKEEIKEEKQEEQEVIELILDSSELKQKAHSLVEQKMSLAKTLEQQLDQSCNLFSQLNSENDYHLYVINAFYSYLLVKNDQDINKLFTMIFCRGSQEVKGQNLKIKYQTQYGDVEKDYSQYLKQTNFPYSLGPHGYNMILDFLEGNFNRLLFKRVITHMAIYNQQLFNSNLNVIINIVKQQKIPQTFSEFIYLLMKRKIVITKKQVQPIVEILLLFKNYEQEIEILLVDMFHNYQWSLDYKDVKGFVKSMIKRRLTDRYMSLYESLKDQFLQRKLKNTEQENYNKLFQDFKNQNKEELRLFVRGIVDDLLSENLLEDARLIMNDAKSIRYQFKVEDYNRWILVHTQQYDDAIQIYQDLLKKYPDDIQGDTIHALLTVIQKSPIQSKQFFTEMIKDYFYTSKIALDDQFVVEISNTFRRLKEFSGFQNFLKFILETGYECTQQHKNLFYKLMNNAEDDVLKSSIKGIVEKIFQNQDIKKKSDKQEIKEQKTEILKSEEYFKSSIVLEGLKPDIEIKSSGKVRKRGGLSKFKQIEDEQFDQSQTQEQQAN